MAMLTPGPIPNPDPNAPTKIEVCFSNRSCSEGETFSTMELAIVGITAWLKSLDPVEHRDAGPWRIDIDIADQED